ncbi:NAD-dependent epimerase/dehydratase family protein [Phenylobacterium sp.]|uniref:NAD-dependent epimerase/dehydratase family protein n=1 Tax=Phenylobacterium sp. TaxID=1871053 RepID=UPI002CD79D34|nr:NAD-dependent epimerase/dehydratase family protein [Phenylobacterium sp.]HVI30560.1 NAD-dependent epimerase/dehydratase family protein [Phenylobacterium sp.]
MSSVVAEDIARILDRDLPWRSLAGRRFLVTGATGMIGQYLVRTLLALGRRTERTRVVAMTRRGREAARLFAAELEAGDLAIVEHDPAHPLPELGSLDHLVHAASPVTPAAFLADPVGVIAANVAGTANLLAVAREQQAVFCLLSSAEIYGQASAEKAARVAEGAAGLLDSLDPRSAYPESKRLAEALCVAYERQHGVAYRIARLAHTYGPGMSLQDPRVQAYFMRQALLGQDITLRSDGQARRTYTYVSDAACGLLHLIAAPGNLTCNIADEGAAVSLSDLARAVLRCCPGTGARLRLAPEAGRGEATVAPPLLDCARLRALGWAPRVDLETGLRRTLQHHREALAAQDGPAPSPRRR